MTTEIADGQVLGLSVIQSGGLTVKGKPVELNVVEDEDYPTTYTGVAYFTDEEKENGAQDQLVVYELDNPVGTVKIIPLLPEFEGLTDAEKFTKLNSLEYQTGKPETTQIADGSQQSPIGVKALRSKAAKDSGKESYKKNSLNKEINSEQAIKKASEEQAKLNKERKANFEEEEQAQKQQQKTVEQSLSTTSKSSANSSNSKQQDNTKNK